MPLVPRAKVEIVRVGVLRRPRSTDGGTAAPSRRAEARRDAMAPAISAWMREDVARRPVVRLRPLEIAARRVGELATMRSMSPARRTLPSTSHFTFNRSATSRASSLSSRQANADVRDATRSPERAREQVHQLLGYAVGEVGVRVGVAEVGERQHGDRVGGRCAVALGALRRRARPARSRATGVGPLGLRSRPRLAPRRALRRTHGRVGALRHEAARALRPRDRARGRARRAARWRARARGGWRRRGCPARSIARMSSSATRDSSGASTASRCHQSTASVARSASRASTASDSMAFAAARAYCRRSVSIHWSNSVAVRQVEAVEERAAVELHARGATRPRRRRPRSRRRRCRAAAGSAARRRPRR